MTAAPARTPSALRYPAFTRFLVARFLSTFAVQMQSVAIGWQVYELTRDPLDLGLIGLAQFLPFLAAVLPAGQIADRHDRRAILTACYATELLCALLLLAFTLSGLPVAWPVFAVLVLFGTARAFSMPTSQAITPNLVPLESFGNAVALNSSSFQIATIAGPTLGGVLYLAGPETVYSTVAVLLGISVALMFAVRVPRMLASDEPVSWHSLLEGLRFVWRRRVVFGAISLDLFAVLLGGATALLPIYASDVLQVGPTGLGLLRTAPGVGAALTALLLVYVSLTRHVGRWMFAGVALFGLATVVFGLSTSFYLSLAALFLLGAGDMVSVYIRHMLIQLETPDAIRGRVSAVSAVFIGASNELGEFRAGVAAAWAGAKSAVVVGGVATLAIAALWARIFPELRTIDRFPGHPARREEESYRAAAPQ
ncbi:MAG TPA: MFS transporter [Steroidobacteraceae bacterium]|nr:MFS transporter [Steroidobacteraceae bacterium]